jgi:hypothetical protein
MEKTLASALKASTLIGMAVWCLAPGLAHAGAISTPIVHGFLLRPASSSWHAGDWLLLGLLFATVGAVIMLFDKMLSRKREERW